MYFYKLTEDYYDGTNEESIILTSDKQYSFKEFQDLVISVSSPDKDDEDYVDEFTDRNMYQIAEVLVYEYDFNYVNCDVCLCV